MSRFILYRLALLVPTLFGVLAVTFLLLYVAPGDPVQSMLGESASPEDIALHRTMLAPWIMEELKTTDLKDRRLNQRLAEVLSQLAAHPTASIPLACGGRAEMEAAYRLFDNDKATFEAFPLAGGSVIRDRGILVHRLPDAVTDELPDHRVAL